jgi:hypothetical protein
VLAGCRLRSKDNPGKYPPALDSILAKKKAFSSVHGACPRTRSVRPGRAACFLWQLIA